jgi:hypothetical protein
LIPSCLSFFSPILLQQLFISIMKYSSVIALLLAAARAVYAGPIVSAPKIATPGGVEGAKHLRPVLERRQEFNQGEPIDANGKGGPILGSQSCSSCV